MPQQFKQPSDSLRRRYSASASGPVFFGAESRAVSTTALALPISGAGGTDRESEAVLASAEVRDCCGPAFVRDGAAAAGLHRPWLRHDGLADSARRCHRSGLLFPEG